MSTDFIFRSTGACLASRSCAAIGAAHIERSAVKAIVLIVLFSLILNSYRYNMGEMNNGIKIRLLNHFCMVDDRCLSKDDANIANFYLTASCFAIFSVLINMLNNM